MSKFGPQALLLSVSGDTLAKQINQYASQDKFSHTSSNNLKQFAQNLSTIQDYRDAEVFISHIMGKPAFYVFRNKRADQLCRTDQQF